MLYYHVAKKHGHDNDEVNENKHDASTTVP